MIGVITKIDPIDFLARRTTPRYEATEHARERHRYDPTSPYTTTWSAILLRKTPSSPDEDLFDAGLIRCPCRASRCSSSSASGS